MVEELSAQERHALHGLGRDQPPAGLEARVTEALRAEGLIAPVRRTTVRSLGLVAAATLLFVAGVGTQRYLLDAEPVATAPSEAASEGSDRYLLLLLEPAGSFLEPAVEVERMREYAEWAGGLAARGLLEAGEKLADGGDVVGAPAPSGPLPTERVTGFFIVLAASEASAQAVAAASPHARHGGRVEVRRIEPT